MRGVILDERGRPQAGAIVHVNFGRLVEMNFRLHDQTLLHVSNWRARDGRDPRTGSFGWSNFKANVMVKKPKQEAQEMKQQKLPRRSLFGYL
ncbi:hypothetical protein R1flu_027601 [Riccia fluitans]|uniref:Uncharacterized protein n=1 Tax=Riccia fluitans TaxID=41844 RepID=A0ABD1XNB7_9MARC